MKDYMEDTFRKLCRNRNIHDSRQKARQSKSNITNKKDHQQKKAGIEPGDIIVSVNGKTYKASEMSAMSNDIKGEEGTEVEITILRGTETKKEFKVKREKNKK